MQQLITLVFIGSNYLLSEAQCSGTICALTAGGTPPPIECIETDGTTQAFTYQDSDTGSEVTEWKDAAIDPIDGTIWVLYSADGAERLGTIEDPINNNCEYMSPDPCIVTRVTDLTAPQLTGMTFDCEGQLYAVSAFFGYIYTLPDQMVSDMITPADPDRCGDNVNCIESLTYQFDGTPLFYRISSLPNFSTNFYTQAGAPPGDGTFETAVTFSNSGKCGASGTEQIETMVYIGMETSLITCTAPVTEIFQLTATPSGAVVSEIPGNPAITTGSHSTGVFSYDGTEICKPDSCTDSPSKHPTTPPSSAPTDDSSDSGSNSSDSNDSSGSNDGALMSGNDFDNGMYNGNNNDKMSETITVNLSDQSIFNLWGLFGAFTIVNIIAFWCYYKRNKNKVKFVNEITPPNIDL